MVEITYLAIIGTGLAAMFFGYGFGLFEGRNQGYKKRRGEEGLEEKEKPATPSEPVTVMVDDPGLLRIKNENGQFTLDLDGTRVNVSAFSVDQRKRLIEMLNLMRPWLEGKPVLTPPPPAPMSVADTRQGAPVAVAPPTPSLTPRPAAPKERAAPKDDRPVAPATSIVGQIDAILQERLAGTALEDRGVFLAQSPDGSVNVYVGLTRYGGIDDVPDAEIKAAIRAAISEWEIKYTPGLK
ncbi:MAG: hypothetical protein M3R47_07350 [Chloroflexota bacterium]|nr:hypothetical protein [Chloroflexota bacterium]